MRLMQTLRRGAASVGEGLWGSAALRMERALTPTVVGTLRSQGFALVDDLMGRDIAARLASEVGALSSGCGTVLHKNSTHLVDKSGTTKFLEKERIWELDARAVDTWDTATMGAAPLLRQVQADSSMATLLNVHAPELRLDSQALKVQYNEGQGGCFPMHFDSDRELDGRQITAIFYLNEGWQDDHGGHLRVYPFPYKPVDIAPVFDRLVLFSSPNMLHRVLPANHTRLCFTNWYSSRSPLLPPDTGKKDGAGTSLRSVLQNHKYRKFVAKAVYADEWARSIEESHSGSEARSEALDKHWKDVEIINNVFRSLLPEARALASALALESDAIGDNNVQMPSRALASEQLQINWLA